MTPKLQDGKLLKLLVYININDFIKKPLSKFKRLTKVKMTKYWFFLATILVFLIEKL